MKKLVAGGVATLGILSGSLGLAVLNPFGVANAQTDGTTSTSTPAATTAPADAPKPGNGLKSVLAGLVTDGTITQAQADAITAKMDAWRAANPAPDHGGKGGRGGAMAGASLDEIAGVLGITADDLHTKLDAGQTLRAIAGDQVDALTALLTTKANERIDQGVTDGRITAETAATMKAEVAAKVQAMLDGTGGPGAGLGGKGGKGGPGGRGGGPRGQAPAAPATGSTGSTTTTN